MGYSYSPALRTTVPQPSPRQGEAYVRKTMTDPILITSALPYTNGSIHLGHLVEYIQTDIFVRFLKMTGRDAGYIFERLRQQGHIVTRPVAQYYCEQDARFLPDRFIRGTCPNPKCRATDQYG